jgi:hypothetical protein
MPSLAEQLRTARHRRLRRRRAVVGALVCVPAAALGLRVVAGMAATSAGAASTTTTEVAAVASTTTSPPTGLHPGIVEAFEQARAAAAGDGHELTINSGFRTAAEQAALLDEEIVARGSRAEALWWVFPPDRSMHVQGLAIDVGDGPAADWLAEEGARYGLCRTLSWEWWHFEWRARWESTGTCPEPAATPEEAPPA